VTEPDWLRGSLAPQGEHPGSELELDQASPPAPDMQPGARQAAPDEPGEAWFRSLIGPIDNVTIE
jgi:hypothetical protein